MTGIRETPFTYILIGLNVLIITGVFLQDGDFNRELLKAGALFAPYSMGEKKLDLLMHMFLHGHAPHLFMNMLALYSLGIFLEKRLYPSVFLLLYFFCGLMAAVCSLYVEPFAMSVGASGAIFGLLGVYFLYIYNNRGKSGGWLFTRIAIIVVLTILLDFFFPIGHVAHIGGFLSGVLAFYIIRHIPSRYGLFAKTRGRNYSFVNMLLLLPVPAVLFLLLPRYPVEYLTYFRRALEGEDKVIALLNTPVTLDEMADLVQEVDTIPGQLLSELDEVSPGNEMLEKERAKWERYWHYRGMQIEYIKLELAHETYRYRDSLYLTGDSLRNVESLAFSPDPLAGEDSVAPQEAPALREVRQYYDETWREVEDPRKASYYRIGRVDSLNRWQGYVQDHYMSDGIQMKGSYNNGLKDGVFLHYSEDSLYKEVSYYVQDDIMGKVEDFHPNGALYHVYRFSYEGGLIISAQDSTGRYIVKDGEGIDISYHPNGKIKEVMPVVGGRITGLVRGYYPDGSLHYEEYYEAGLSQQGYAIDSTGHRHTYDMGYLPGMPEGGMEAYEAYLHEHNRLTSDTTSLEATIRFRIHTDGRLSDFRVIESTTHEMDQEAIRLIKEGPAWIPAYQHGYIPVPFDMTLKVPFYELPD